MNSQLEFNEEIEMYYKIAFKDGIRYYKYLLKLLNAGEAMLIQSGT
jgi:hypothetical protein